MSCYLAIWSRVKKSGLQVFYSCKSEEPKFGSFIRLCLGLPFLKITDLNNGLKNIEISATKLSHERCKSFADSTIKYIKNEWMNRDLNHWNMFQVDVRTNNRKIGIFCLKFVLNVKAKLLYLGLIEINLYKYVKAKLKYVVRINFCFSNYLSLPFHIIFTPICESDQTGVHHTQLRKLAVSNIQEMIHQNILFWIETESIQSWMDRMSQERCHGDNNALQVLRYMFLIF